MASANIERTRSLVSAALVSALLAATSWLSAQLPATAVPITPQMFFVVLAALLLPVRWAAASIATYVVLGAVGLPVFSGGRGGLGVLAGPTGGYLIGFVVAALLGALIRESLEGRSPRWLPDIVAAIVVVLVSYAVGTVQLAIVANLSPAQAFLSGVAPFVVFDSVKAGIAIGIAAAVRRARG